MIWVLKEIVDIKRVWTISYFYLKRINIHYGQKGTGLTRRRDRSDKKRGQVKPERGTGQKKDRPKYVI